MISELYNLFFNFVYDYFYEAFYMIYYDLSDTGITFIGNDEIMLEQISFIFEIITKVIFVILIFLAFYCIYKLTMFIVRRFINV